MQFKNTELFALCTLFQWIHGSNAHRSYSSFEGQTDPSNYLFYDPTEECKDHKGPCVMNFKYCSRSAGEYAYDLWDNTTCPSGAEKQDDLRSWGGDQVEQWLEIDTRPRPVFRADLGTYTLKWTNNNPDYPTTVVWSFSNIYNNGFYMYKEVDAGKDSWDFVFDNLADDMLPGSLVPANASTEFERNTTKYLADFAQSSPRMWFSVGQPEDPENIHNFKNDTVTTDFWGGPNATDKTASFRLISHDSDWLFFSQRSAREYVKEERHETHLKWGVGVGVGVGVGLPLLMLISFIVGTKSGAKKAAFKKQEVHSDDTELPEYSR